MWFGCLGDSEGPSFLPASFVIAIFIAAWFLRIGMIGFGAHFRYTKRKLETRAVPEVGTRFPPSLSLGTRQRFKSQSQMTLAKMTKLVCRCLY